MSKAQIRKLHTILAKLEALEKEVGDPPVCRSLRSGKNELLRALAMCETAANT
jgi:hypothetical protein